MPILSKFLSFSTLSCNPLLPSTKRKWRKIVKRTTQSTL